MSLASSLNVGVSALRAYSEGIQVVSNNIANVNTVGYKSSHAQYSDTFSNILKPLVPNENNTAVKIAPTQVGGGVQVESISPVFSQGTIQTTSSNSDMAIAGNGFFRVKNPQTGQFFVTRAGNFRVDADGYVVTQQGYRLQGSAGASTKVVYDAVNQSYDVRGQQDNVQISIPPGINKRTVTGLLTANSDELVVSSADLSVLKVGMPISGGSLPTGTKVSRIEGTKVYLSNKATASQGTLVSGAITNGVSLTASLLTVDSASLNLTFPADYTRPELVAGMIISGPGIVPGTTVESARGNLKTSIPASASSVTLSGLAMVSGSTTVSVTSVAGLRPGMVLSTSSGYSAGTKVRIASIDAANSTVTLDQAPSFGSSVSKTTASAANSSPVTLTDVSGLSAGMEIKTAAGALVGYIGEVNTGAKTVTVLGADGNAVSSLSVGSGASLTFTSRLSGLTAVAAGDKTLTSGTSVLYVPSAAGITVGMSVSGFGLPPGARVGPGNNTIGLFGETDGFGNFKVPLVDESGKELLITSDSYNPVSLAFGDQTVVLSKRPNADTFDATRLSVSTDYTPASRLGDVKVSFNEGTDFSFYGTDGVKLSGIPLEAARAASPKIRTFNVGTNGQINVILSNGQTFSGGSVLLQTFKDPGALTREGDNLFSGIYTAGPYNGDWADDNITGLTPSTGGLGSINGGALELSNVDIGEEFSTMIITQRAFQAGSRVISTSDQMLEEAVNLKR